MPPFDSPISQVLNDYKAAVLAKDVDAFVALYDRDVRVFDMWGEWAYSGLEAWRAMAAGWFGSLGTERVVVDFSEVQATVTEQLAVAHAFVRYAAVTSDDVELRALNNRLTITLVRRDGTWKIIHEHSSSPIDAETMKAILNR